MQLVKGLNYFKLFIMDMTQITNVLYIVIITIAMCVGATLLTILVDHSIDVPTIVDQIPHLIINQILQM
jgi:hypothetical protein